MALTDEDVREILRIIDESGLDELRIETGDLSLHVLRGDAVACVLDRCARARAACCNTRADPRGLEAGEP